MIVGLFLLVLGPRFIAWWVGRSSTIGGRSCQILMVSYLVFLPIRGVAFILMGLGKPRLPTIDFSSPCRETSS